VGPPEKLFFDRLSRILRLHKPINTIRFVKKVTKVVDQQVYFGYVTLEDNYSILWVLYGNGAGIAWNILT
jgi:hypothetical protein